MMHGGSRGGGGFRYRLVAPLKNMGRQVGQLAPHISRWRLCRTTAGWSSSRRSNAEWAVNAIRGPPSCNPQKEAEAAAGRRGKSIGEEMRRVGSGAAAHCIAGRKHEQIFPSSRPPKPAPSPNVELVAPVRVPNIPGLKRPFPGEFTIELGAALWPTIARRLLLTPPLSSTAAPSNDDSCRLSPSELVSSSTGTKVAQVLGLGAESCPNWAEDGRNHKTSAESGSNSAEMGPTPDNFGRHRAKRVQILDKLGPTRIALNFGRCRPSLGRLRPTHLPPRFAQTLPDMAGVRAHI